MRVSLSVLNYMCK